MYNQTIDASQTRNMNSSAGHKSLKWEPCSNPRFCKVFLDPSEKKPLLDNFEGMDLQKQKKI